LLPSLLRRVIFKFQLHLGKNYEHRLTLIASELEKTK